MSRERDKYGRIEDPYTKEELLEAGERYFKEVDVSKQGIFGLCRYLGISKTTFYHYLDSEDKELQDAAQWIATKLGEKYEDMLARSNSTGTLFILKQKPFGFSDKQDIDVKGNGTFNIISSVPRPKEK